MNSLTLAIPIMNQLADCVGILNLLKVMTSEDVEWLIVDNGSTEPVENFIRKTLRPKRLNYIRNKENLGLVKTYQQIHEACETEILAILHNDVFIYEKDWNKRVLSYFKEIPDLGMAGFFGAQGCLEDGGRLQDVDYPGEPAGLSNLVEAEIHGMRMKQPYVPAAIFDGFALIFRQKMLKEAGGIDQRYYFHHLYDREISLLSLALGYKNIVVDVPCHHVSGMTANHPEYQTWIDKKMGTKGYKGDSATHIKNTEIFTKKWEKFGVLPLYVENDFSFRKGKHGDWTFQGNKIFGCLK